MTMKVLKTTLMSAVVLLGAAQAVEALAHGGRYHSRAHVGVFIGAPVVVSPFFYYPYFHRPYYYYHPYPPAVVVRPQAPTVYIEQGQPAQQSGAFWYYCPDSQTYYPYVDRCAVPWQRVVPQPPPS
jgi:hypothetical protein